MVERTTRRRLAANVFNPQHLGRASFRRLPWFMVRCWLFIFICAVEGIAQAQTTSPSTAPQPAAGPDAEQLARSIAKLQVSVDELGQSSILSDWTPIAAVLVTAIVALITLLKSTRTNVLLLKETMAEKAREEERKAIREKIDGFYAPFLQLRGTSALLYRKAFALRRTKDEVDKYSDADGHFKTFIALVRGHKFTGADELLLEQIIDIGQSTAKLIYDKIGLVTDPGIQETLARATAHYRLIQIAFLNPERFQGAGAEFELFTFPADLDQMVRETLSGLNARLQTLTTTSALSQPRRREIA